MALYDMDELRWALSKNVRRWDLVMGGLTMACIGYLILRSGNAPAAWRPGWEQSFRELLETALVARPRFKEFAIGFPALWVGCYVRRLYLQKKSAWDGRLLIGVGMIGPISMINTFCHLHSPLKLELWRSFNGVVLGSLLGFLAVAMLRRWLVSKPPISIPISQQQDALAYQRSL